MGRNEKRKFEWKGVKVGQVLLKLSYDGAAYKGVAWQPKKDIAYDGGVGAGDLADVNKGNPRGRAAAGCEVAQEFSPGGGGEEEPANRIDDSRPRGSAAGVKSSLKKVSGGDGCATVEEKLFEAMEKTCLIQSRTSCNFSRCGRTDKGVHARGNYVSVRLRLRKKGEDRECQPMLDYPTVLNAVLPSDIRIVEALRVPEDFDARFNCLYRVYKYYFVSFGQFDIEKMNREAESFVGDHDFRNFCKIDPQVVNFRRRILSCKVIQCHSSDSTAQCVAVIKGLSFLWHQIRCMMAVLFMVGRGEESEGIVTRLLDVESRPQKPSCRMADAQGLVLFDCFFEGMHFEENAGEDDTRDTPLSSKEIQKNAKRSRLSFVEELESSLVRTAVYRCLAGDGSDSLPDTAVLESAHTLSNLKKKALSALGEATATLGHKEHFSL